MTTTHGTYATETAVQAHALNRLNAVSGDLLSGAADLIRTLEQAQLKVENGQHLLSSGELQSSGVTFDRNCAIRAERVETVVRLGCLQEHVEIAAKGERKTWFVSAAIDKLEEAGKEGVQP
jgi:hypothetical protein